MDYERVMEAFGECEKLVLAEVDTVDVREYLLDMIRRAREMGPERKEKLMRWLGFVQGVLWTWGVPLDVIKSTSKPKDEPLAEEPKDGEFYSEYVARCGSENKYGRSWNPEHFGMWSSEHGRWVAGLGA